MLTQKPTLRSTLAATIFIIGLLGLILVLSTEQIYRKFALEHQENAFEALLTLKTDDLINELINHQKELGFRLQSEEEFKSAYNAGNTNGLIYWLDQEFNRYFVTIGLLKLEKIIVYDEHLGKFASSERGISMNNSDTTPCSALIKSVKNLNIAKRLKPHSQICLFDGKPLLSTLVSIGGLRPKGYIQIISDPAHMLAKVQDELGTQIQITAPDGIILHQSDDWQAYTHGEDNFIFSHILPTSSGSPALKIAGVADLHNFNKQLTATRNKVVGFALVLITLALAFALYIIRTGLKPLKDLEKAAHSIRNGSFISVDESAYPEIATPIRSFNEMTDKIQSLIENLEKEVAEHRKTENRLVQAKEQAEQHAASAEHQRNFSQLTLQSIIDGVITTDISGNITSMNPMAEQLSGWSREDAHGKPISDVMRILDESTKKRIDNPIENIEYRSVLDEPVSAILKQNESGIETPVEYVVAPMRNNNSVIVGIVIIIHDESVQRSLNRQLTFQATHDALTGLINRYELERRVKNILTSPPSDTVKNTLCYLDLDQFKLVNDTCGHAAGDELLKQITFMLQQRIRDEDSLARLGGDEFGLLLEHCDVKQAQDIAEHMIETIKQFNFNWDDYNFSISASIGIVDITADINSCEELLSRADSACHLAKESGKNSIQIYASENDRLITQQREMHWVSRINHALEEGRFQLYFQQIAPLKSSEGKFINHGEILLRMIDKEGDIISPNTFLSAAERYNMIRMIDEWVLENTIYWLSRRQQKVLVSVNLSGMSLSDKSFLNFVVSKIKEYRINAELLCFEITETAAISHLTTAIHFMTVLKKLGCTFALDDFGSGLSSFSYLTSLPVDYLKIDGSFVVDIDKDPMHYAMVKSINEVGQVMGIKTIAEYAASEDIITCLKEIGVDHAQGYAVARPLPLAVINDKERPQSPTDDTSMNGSTIRKLT
jgi:diguanylate cyclase (GGDEF)-like protein/PAS domain S-box-containing protein